ncbi:MAG: DsbA family protein [Mariprofundus sp.]|nr:DsbA family protein [Mariprofundus sp.]
MSILYYIHDPMCSWCWAFRPVWTAVQAQLPDGLKVKYLLGGLAPDSDAPMPAETRAMIRRHWQMIEHRVPGTLFNHAFWSDCTPRRSTYPACRAVIAARNQLPGNGNNEDAMILAIQQAYYLQARNPSDETVLIELAAALALDVDRFRAELNAPVTQAVLNTDMQLNQQLGVQGFPGLVFKDNRGVQHIEIDYNDSDAMVDSILQQTMAGK